MQPRTHVMVKSSKSFWQGGHSFWGENSTTFQGLSRTLISFFQHSSHRVTQLVQHHNSTTISLRFNGHFPAGCELASTGMSPVWTLLKQDDGCGGDNWSYEMSQTVTTNKPTSNFLQVGCPSCRPNQQCQSTEGICYYGYYAALLPRRGPHIASHSVCLSVCPSVCPSVCLSVRPVRGCTLFTVARSYERSSKIEKLLFSLMGQRHVCTFRHAQRAAYRTAISAAQILVIILI